MAMHHAARHPGRGRRRHPGRRHERPVRRGDGGLHPHHRPPHHRSPDRRRARDRAPGRHVRRFPGPGRGRGDRAADGRHLGHRLGRARPGHRGRLAGEPRGDRGRRAQPLAGRRRGVASRGPVDAPGHDRRRRRPDARGDRRAPSSKSQSASRPLASLDLPPGIARASAPMQPLRIALLGCGAGALRHHLPILARMPDALLVAVAEPDPRAATAALARAPGARGFADWREALADADVHAAIVCLPSADHAEAALAALARGCAVYVEKPLATTLADADRVVAAWRASGLVGMTGFNYRFIPLYDAARRAIAAGDLGRLISVRTHVHALATRPPGLEARARGGRRCAPRSGLSPRRPRPLALRPAGPDRVRRAPLAPDRGGHRARPARARGWPRRPVRVRLRGLGSGAVRDRGGESPHDRRSVAVPGRRRRARWRLAGRACDGSSAPRGRSGTSHGSSRSAARPAATPRMSRRSRGSSRPPGPAIRAHRISRTGDGASRSSTPPSARRGAGERKRCRTVSGGSAGPRRVEPEPSGDLGRGRDPRPRTPGGIRRALDPRLQSLRARGMGRRPEPGRRAPPTRSRSSPDERVRYHRSETEGLSRRPQPGDRPHDERAGRDHRRRLRSPRRLARADRGRVRGRSARWRGVRHGRGRRARPGRGLHSRVLARRALPRPQTAGQVADRGHGRVHGDPQIDVGVARRLRRDAGSRR